MAKVNLDGKEYDIDSLSESAKAQVASLQFVQSELLRLQAQTAVYKTAEAAYINALKKDVDENNQ